MNIQQLKYPIGKYQYPSTITDKQLAEWIASLESFPERLNNEVCHLTTDQLNTPYRPEGWTVRQVVNHCADSHMNSVVRYKLALTESKPTIKAYEQDKWADLVDSRETAITPALKLIEGLHIRWVHLLRSLDRDQWKRSFIHPESGSAVTLEQNTSLYAWHCDHHLAQITQLKKQKGWK